MTLDRIAAALDRLRAAYQANDAEGIEKASRELDELGQAQLAIAGVDERKRAAIVALAGEWDHTYDPGGYGEYDEYLRSEWAVEDIAYVLALPQLVVAGVIELEERVSRENADRVRVASDEASTRRVEARRLVLSRPCPSCGAQARGLCVSRNGKRITNPHAERSRCRCGHLLADHHFGVPQSCRHGCPCDAFEPRSEAAA